MENESKRSRSSNWNESEKSLLTRLIKEKIHLIENKDVSKNNNQMKKAAWQEIFLSFNQLNDTRRDLSQLINQWRNTKNNIKKRDFEYRQSRNATGGGPRPHSPPPGDIEIIELLPKEFEIDNNIYYDSDSLNNKKVFVDKTNVMDLTQPSCLGTSLPTVTVMSPGTDVPSKKYDTMEICEDVQTPVVETPNKKRPMSRRPKKRIIPENEAHELYILTKSIRLTEHNRRMEMMEIEHEKRLEVIEKEKQYWDKRSRKLDQ